MVILTTEFLCKPTVELLQLPLRILIQVTGNLVFLNNLERKQFSVKNMVDVISSLFAYCADRQLTELQSPNCKLSIASACLEGGDRGFAPHLEDHKLLYVSLEILLLTTSRRSRTPWVQLFRKGGQVGTVKKL